MQLLTTLIPYGIRIVSTPRRSVEMSQSIGDVHPTIHEWSDPNAAIAFLESHEQSRVARQFVRYEISVRFNNGDEIRGQFQAKDAAIEFLETLR